MTTDNLTIPRLRTRILTEALTDTGAGWSMGSFGAICEFHHVEGDPEPEPGPGCMIANPRGGLRLWDHPALVPVAWEQLSPRRHRWQQGVSLCLPADVAVMSVREGLTELGPDHDALRPQDRGAILFDLGLSQPQVDYCIRTSDPELLAILRANSGRPVLDHGNPVMPAVLPRHPHRIALTRIGRMEVFQKIGGPDTGGVSPVGPHTHLLPQLMRSGRTHSANTPIPAGLVPVAGFHPASAVMTPLGDERDFDTGRFARFQDLLALWGDPDRLRLKRAVWAELESRHAPDNFTAPADRFGRVALRVALRQALRRDGENDVLRAWLRHFDGDTETAGDQDAPGH